MPTTQYAGNPNGVPPSIPIPDASISPSPAAVLAPVQATFDGVVSLKQQLMRSTLQNYLPAIMQSSIGLGGLSSEASLKCLVAAYNPALFRWNLCVRGGTTGKLLICESYDQGRTMNAFSYVDSPNTIGTNFVGLAASPLGVSTVVNTDSGGNLNVTGFSVFNGFRQTALLVGPALTATHGIVRYDSGPGKMFAVMANQGVSSWSSGAMYLVGVDPPGTTPTLTAVTLPSSLVSGSGNVDFNSSQGYVAASNGSGNTLLGVKGGTPGTDVALLFVMSWNGTTYLFTPVTAPFLSGQIIVGVAWTGSLYFIAAYNGTLTSFYSSPDGLTWSTALGQITGQCSGLDACGSVMVFAGPDPFTSAIGAYRLFTTTDGASYQPGNFSFGTNSNSTTPIISAHTPTPLKAGQITAINFTNFIASHCNF